MLHTGIVQRPDDSPSLGLVFKVFVYFFMTDPYMHILVCMYGLGDNLKS